MKTRICDMADNIIEDCYSFESPSSFSKTKKIDQSFSKVSLIYSELHHQNFNPNVQEFLSLSNRKSQIDAYLESRRPNVKTLRHEFQNIFKNSQAQTLDLRTETQTLTFDNIQNQRFTQLMTKNKREFGKNWQDTDLHDLSSKQANRFHFLLPSISADPTSPTHTNSELARASAVKNSADKTNNLKPNKKLISNSQIPLNPISLSKKLDNPNEKSRAKIYSLALDSSVLKNDLLSPIISPSYRSSTKNSPMDVNRSVDTLLINKPSDKSFNSDKKNQKLGVLISKLLEKNLGIRKKPVLKELLFEKKQERKPTKQKKEEDYNIGLILNPEYLNFNNNSNIETSLRIQKMIVANHQKIRRLTLWNFPPVKRSKQDDDINY